jgi:hypothetical protein
LAAPPDDLAGVWLPEAGVVASGAIDRVGEGCPDVKTAPDADEAPEKATAPAVALGLAIVVLAGFRTLDLVS